VNGDGIIRRVLFVLVTLGLAAGGVAAIYLSVTLIPLRSNNPMSLGRGPVPLLGVSSPTARQGPRENTLAPALKAPRFGGGELSLADLHGKGVVINFFASWCVPCRLEARDLEATYHKYRGKGVAFLGVNIQQDDWDDVYGFLKAFSISYPAVRDATGEVAQRYSVFGLPTTYFIDKNGLIRSKYVGGFLGKEGMAELERRIQIIQP